VDGDVFSKVARPGRAAADAVMRALDGGMFDPFCAALCLDKLIAAAEGVPSLPGVLREVRTPDALPLFAGVLRENTGQRIASAVANAKGVVAPFFFHTKGALCREAGAALSQLATVTMSCDEGEGHKPNAMDHCRLCTSCIFRRIALFAAGLANDPTPYRDVPTRRHGLYELRAFEHHAEQLAKCATFDDLIEIDADARFACHPSTEHALTKDEAERRVLAMYATYRQEVSEFFARARPILHQRSKPLQQENERDLFAAAR
jgi:hypothetical protein